MSSSWIEIRPECDFSLENIPFGVASFGASKTKHCCTAIGDNAVSLSILAEAGLFKDVEEQHSNFCAVETFSKSTLNEFMSYPKPVWVAVRLRLIDLFRSNGDDALRSDEKLRSCAIYPLRNLTMHLPCDIGDYTDFYSSLNHATNVGIMIRGKDNALQANWKHLPVGYHGRCSSIYISGTNITRPSGQLQKDKGDPNQGSLFSPTQLLDFELEMAFFCGGPVADRPITMEEAPDRIFGFVLMNDWSARDIQKWEYVPLGPFGSKNFATSISPWIVTTMALEAFRCPPSECAKQDDPEPLEYLRDPSYSSSSYDIKLAVSIQGEGMDKPEIVCRSNYRNLYWNSKQQLVHHAVTGCNITPGDLLGTGTISGTDPSSLGCMLELSWMGSREVKLGDSSQVRKFLKDGDTVIMEGHCQKDNFGRVGFGKCVGKILPALSMQDVPAKNHPPEQLPQRFVNLKLYSYWRSSCSWRVRVALAAKNLTYEYIPVHLLKKEQQLIDSPMAQVPVLECKDSETGEVLRISQSLAIIDFIEDAFSYHGGSLFPSDIKKRTFARELAEIINSGTQPLSNLSTINKIETILEGKGVAFAKEAVENGLRSMEALVKELHSTRDNEGPFLCGSFCPTIADACVVPQIYGARRLGIELDTICPTLVRIYQRCLKHPWFIMSHPEVQKDAAD